MKVFALAAIAAVSFAPVALAQTAPAPAPAPAAPAPAAATAKFNLDTPIQDIVADPKAKAALDTAIPGVSTHASYEMFKGMSLRAVAPMSGGAITDAALANAEKALAEVK